MFFSNMTIFSSVRIYRKTPSTFYILFGSIDNMFYILINLTTRILDVGYGNYIMICHLLIINV